MRKNSIHIVVRLGFLVVILFSLAFDKTILAGSTLDTKQPDCAEQGMTSPKPSRWSGFTGLISKICGTSKNGKKKKQGSVENSDEESDRKSDDSPNSDSDRALTDYMAEVNVAKVFELMKTSFLDNKRRDLVAKWKSEKLAEKERTTKQGIVYREVVLTEEEKKAIEAEGAKVALTDKELEGIREKVEEERLNLRGNAENASQHLRNLINQIKKQKNSTIPENIQKNVRHVSPIGNFAFWKQGQKIIIYYTGQDKYGVPDKLVSLGEGGGKKVYPALQYSERQGYEPIVLKANKAMVPGATDMWNKEGNLEKGIRTLSPSGRLVISGNMADPNYRYSPRYEGNFSKLLDSGWLKPEDDSKLADLMAKATEGILDLHRGNVCHRDIHPDNFVFNKAPNDQSIVEKVGVIDFGISQKFGKLGKYFKNKVLLGAHPTHLSPESFVDKVTFNSCMKQDVFALGVVALQFYSKMKGKQGLLPEDKCKLTALLQDQEGELRAMRERHQAEANAIPKDQDKKYDALRARQRTEEAASQKRGMEKYFAEQLPQCIDGPSGTIEELEKLADKDPACTGKKDCLPKVIADSLRSNPKKRIDSKELVQRLKNLSSPNSR